MANTYKNIVITPNIGNTSDPKIVFSGANSTVNTDITLYTYPDSNGTLSFEGSAGQLFSITNDLSNNLFGVNDVSGIPSLEVYANGLVSIAPFSGNVGIGNAASTDKLSVNGTTYLGGAVTVANSTLTVTNGAVTITKLTGDFPLTVVGNSFGAITGIGYGLGYGVQGNSNTGNGGDFRSTSGNPLYVANNTYEFFTVRANGAVTVNLALIVANTTTANASGVYTSTINAASYTVATNFIANSTGVYHSGVINATSYSIGTAFTANTTVVNAASYYAGGTLVGNSTGPYGKTEINLNVNSALTANNSTNLGGTAAASYQLNSTLNANIASYLPTYTGIVNGSSHTVGTSTIANSTGVYTGVVNGSSIAVGTAFTANATVVNAVTYYVGSTLIANSTGPYGKLESALNVNSALTANNSTNLSGQPGSYFTNAANMVTGLLSVARGGTNSSMNPVSGGVVYSNATGMAITTAGTNTYVLASNGTAPNWTQIDMAYLPEAVFKKSCRAATTADLSAASATAQVLTGGLVALPAQDGVTLVLNDRLLVKDQSNTAQNGIFYVSNTGSAATYAWTLTRANDANTTSRIASALVAIDSGTINGGKLFDNDFKTTDIIGTTAMPWNYNIDGGGGVFVGSVYPNSNTLLLGNTTARWVVSANTIDAAGGTFVTNATGVYITNTTSTISSDIESGSTWRQEYAFIYANTAALATIQSVYKEQSYMYNKSTGNSAYLYGYSLNQYNGNTGGGSNTNSFIMSGFSSAITNYANAIGGNTLLSTAVTFDSTIATGSINSTGNIGTAYGIRVNISPGLLSTNSGAINTIYGLRADLAGGATSAASGNCYVVYGAYTASANTNGTLYGIYITNSANNYLSGNAYITNSIFAGTTLIGNSTGPYGKTEATLNVNSALTANNSTNLGGTAAASYQLNSTLNANIAAYLPTYTGTVNAASYNVGSLLIANSTAITSSSGAGAISFTNATSNWITWNTSGVAAPAVTTRSAGTKLNLYPSIGASSVDYALGIESGALWFSAAASTNGFKWYANTTNFMSANIAGLYHTGLVNAASLYATTNTSTFGTAAYVVANGNIGIGNSAPALKLEVNGNMAVQNIIEYSANVTANVSITTGRNALSAGPLTINSGVVVTIPSGSVWTIT